jgi:hypothetical protein
LGCGRAFCLRSCVRKTRQFANELPAFPFLGARQNAAPSRRNPFFNGLLFEYPKPLDAHKGEIMRYRIARKHSGTTEVIVEKYVFPSLKVARVVARAMNAAWPETQHWPVDSENDAGKQSDDFAAKQPADAVAEGIEV